MEQNKNLESKFKEALGSRIPSFSGDNTGKLFSIIGIHAEGEFEGVKSKNDPFVRIDWYDFPVDEGTQEKSFLGWIREFYEEKGYFVDSHVTTLAKEGRESYVDVRYREAHCSPNHLLVSISNKGGQ